MPPADTPPAPSREPELKPCPDPRMPQCDPKQLVIRGGRQVVCGDCGVAGPFHPSKEYAVAGWNALPRRAAAPAPGASEELLDLLVSNMAVPRVVDMRDDFFDVQIPTSIYPRVWKLYSYKCRELVGQLSPPAGGAEGEPSPSHPNAEENVTPNKMPPKTGTGIWLNDPRDGQPWTRERLESWSVEHSSSTSAPVSNPYGALFDCVRDITYDAAARVASADLERDMREAFKPEPSLPPLPTAQEFAAATCKEWGNGLSPWWEVIELHVAPLLSRLERAEKRAGLIEALPPCPETEVAGGIHGFACVLCGIHLDGTRYATPEHARTVRVRVLVGVVRCEEGEDYRVRVATWPNVPEAGADRFSWIEATVPLPTQEPESEVKGEVSDAAE